MPARKKSERQSQPSRYCGPDLDAILCGFNDARSVLECVYSALDSNESGDEILCMRFGLDLLQKAYTRLDVAIPQVRGPPRKPIEGC